MNETEDRARLTIVLADDSQTVRQTVQRYLESDNCRVITAADGFEAIARVVECRPSLVLLDVMMPRLDGYQACTLIRNNPDYRHIPIFLLSGLDDQEHGPGGSNAADDYLCKPFTRDTLLGVVRRHAVTVEPASDESHIAERSGAERKPVPTPATAIRADETAETSDA